MKFKRSAWCFERVDLPPCSLRASFQYTIEIVRRMLRRRIGTDVTGAKTILNGQQIHTFLHLPTDRKHGRKLGLSLETRLFTENLLN